MCPFTCWVYARISFVQGSCKLIIFPSSKPLRSIISIEKFIIVVSDFCLLNYNYFLIIIWPLHSLCLKTRNLKVFFTYLFLILYCWISFFCNHIISLPRISFCNNLLFHAGWNRRRCFTISCHGSDCKACRKFFHWTAQTDLQWFSCFCFILSLCKPVTLWLFVKVSTISPTCRRYLLPVLYHTKLFMTRYAYQSFTW